MSISPLFYILLYRTKRFVTVWMDHFFFHFSFKYFMFSPFIPQLRFILHLAWQDLVFQTFLEVHIDLWLILYFFLFFIFSITCHSVPIYHVDSCNPYLSLTHIINLFAEATDIKCFSEITSISGEWLHGP